MKTKLSIVVPFFNEVDNVRALHRSISNVLIPLNYTYETIFVDDGSTDGTLEVMRQIQATDPTLRVIQFRKNFGQTAAMRAGIDAARGAVIVTMDGDLQNDPKDIPKLLSKLDEGFDLVIGWRKDRKDPTLSRTLPSRIANSWIGWITGVRVHDSGCSLKAYRSEMIKQVPLYSEMHRFIPAMSQLRAARIAEVIVTHHARQRGKSKYGLARIGKVLLDVVAIKMLISFRLHPLLWFSVLAIPFACLACVAACAYAGGLVFDNSHLLVSAIAFLLFSYLATHFFCVGLLAELVIRAGNRQAFPKVGREHVN